jgi:hypothetical protein
MHFLSIDPTTEKEELLQLQEARKQFNDFARKQAEQKEVLEQMLVLLAKDDEKALLEMLTDDQPLMRLLATQTVGRRRLHLELPLIHQLDDPEPQVREAAHQALVRLSRGADFGPPVNSKQQQSYKAMSDWQYWLALQESPGLVAAAQQQRREAQAGRLVAAPDDKK